MRKVFVLMATLLCVFANAQVGEFNLFAPNDKGEVVITKTYPTSLSQADAAKAVVRALSGDDGNFEAVGDHYRGSFQSQSYYNPFTGATRRSLKMDVTVTVANGQATIVLSDISMTEVYAGYGMHENVIQLNNRMADYRDALNMVRTKSGSKSEIKQAKDLIEDTEDDIQPSEQELASRLNRAASLLR